MKSDLLLSKLEKVRARGLNSWTARCPAHQDRSPSLSITEKEDGKILLKCFAGCPVESIVAAVGLQLSDIMPDTPMEPRAPVRRPFNPQQVFESVINEIAIVHICAGEMQRGRVLPKKDKERLDLAVDRLMVAKGLMDE